MDRAYLTQCSRSQQEADRVGGKDRPQVNRTNNTIGYYY